VTSTGGTYNVHVGAGLLAHLDRLLPPLRHARTAVLLAAAADHEAADTAAGALRRCDLGTQWIEVPHRRQSKDLATIARLARRLADLAVHKDDIVVGAGGEAVCDIAGFLAGTCNRGMPPVLLPATLAAQVRRPGDPFSKHVQNLCEGEVATLTEVIARSVTVKAAIVSNDEQERGNRLHLNYGHTFGHAIEQVRGPDSEDDGEAIALGMTAAAYPARRQGASPTDSPTRRRHPRRCPA
jgi:3-dehydroquinate synthetase